MSRDSYPLTQNNEKDQCLLPNKVTYDIEKGIRDKKQEGLDQIYEAESNKEYSPDIKKAKALRKNQNRN